jgi:FkbM family methyltransferase
VTDKTVTFRPFPGKSFSLTGSDADAGVIGELERSGGQYQRDMATLLLRRLVPDAVVVDGGAHIGVLTVLLANLCREGQVHAFEPVPQNEAYLRANLAANGAKNVTVEVAALFDVDGELALSFDEAYPGGSHVGDGSARVRSVRLDTWAAERKLDRLDLIKLDVEGVELAVLDGAAETIRQLRPVTIVECNPVALARFGGVDFRRLYARMRELFPFVARIGPGGEAVPLVDDDHLERALNHHGVVDLIGVADPRFGAAPARADRFVLPLARLRGQVDAARLRKVHNRWRPPQENFVVDPGGIELRPQPARLDGGPAETLRVGVDVRNGSSSWLSSQFPYEPVHLSYRWFDRAGSRVVDEGHRTPFPKPLGPGQEVHLDVTVQLPAEAGEYEVALTLVQEHFAWLDEIDARCTARVPATVTAGPE